MKWCIVTDSSCDFDDVLPEGIQFARVPFIINVGKTDYPDDESLSVPEMLDDMEASPVSHTSCPAPEAYVRAFEQADNTLAVTISANLSGSYNSACLARDMVLESHPGKHIEIINSRSSGSALSMIVRKAIEMIAAQQPDDNVFEKTQEYAQGLHTVFALSSFGNLVKNGRVSKLVGLIARTLNIWGIGIASREGQIVLKDKVRGARAAVNAMIKDMRENGFAGGEVIISHCLNSECAQQLRDKISELWNNARVTILPTHGLNSYYAERHGLIIAY